MLLWIKELTCVCHFFMAKKSVCQIQFLCFSDKPETPWLGVFLKRIISFSDSSLKEENQFKCILLISGCVFYTPCGFFFLNSAQNYYHRNHRRKYPPPASWSIFLVFPPHGPLLCFSSHRRGNSSTGRAGHTVSQWSNKLFLWAGCSGGVSEVATLISDLAFPSLHRFLSCLLQA